MPREKYKPSAALIKELEKRFLAGETLREVKERYCDHDIPQSCIAPVRIALFKRMQNDPQILKDLANGPLLNANSVVRYTGMRRAVNAKEPVQTSIIEACEA